MLGKLLSAATALTVLVGVPVAAETYAGRELNSSVRAAVTNLAPGATITRVESHGRPFFAALLEREVSSAYVDVRSPSGTTTLILQRLHRDTGQANTVLWFPRLPNPTDLIPVLTPGGAYTPQATTRLDGKQVEVIYGATVQDGTVTVRPVSLTVDGRGQGSGAIPAAWHAALTPEPVQLAAAGALTVTAVSVGERDITVELQAEDVDTRTVQRTSARG